jgi:uncharacterized protein (TIGR02996 family)
MSALDDLLDACVANPDDDAPRLVWADAVGGERGEFVVLQCRLAREELSVTERGALIARHDELLDAHGRAWSGYEDVPVHAERCTFRRGFVEAIELDVVDLPWTEVFDRAPLVQSLHIKGITSTIDYRESDKPVGVDAVAAMARMLDDPMLQLLRGIELDDAVTYELTGDTEWDFDSTSHGDKVLELVASTGKLAGFRTLALRDSFTARGMHELLSSNVLASIECLAFEFGECDAAQAKELFASLPKLRALDIGHVFDLGKIAALIPTTVVELRAAGVQQHDLFALVESPVAASIERLELEGGGDANARPLPRSVALPKLRSLDVGYDVTSAASLLASRANVPLLRELCTYHNADLAMLGPILEEHGRHLELLDVLGADQLAAPEAIAELRAKVAGHVRAGKYRVPEQLLNVGIDTREPWIRYGHVQLRR